VRERPFIAHNIEMTRRATRSTASNAPVPRGNRNRAVDPADNQTTLGNIRSGCAALQDTLRQIQEIRTYYDFPISTSTDTKSRLGRQMMLAVRELNVDKLPQSSRNWINEKLIYTHGYGVTMNPVNGFTPEDCDLILSTCRFRDDPSVRVTRPEIYYGELTDTDVYVKTRRRNSTTAGGCQQSHLLPGKRRHSAGGGCAGRSLHSIGGYRKAAVQRRCGFGERLLMRRKLSERVQELAPFLTFDPDRMS